MKISIGIPFYNVEEYLAGSINSVIKQTFQDWELILVDDGSTDNSLEIANNFAKIDKRIRVISDGLNRKLPYRLNQIIQESKYDYIARMDADDLMHPKRLELQLKFLLNNPEYDLVSTGLVSINKYNEVKGYRCIEKEIKDIGKDFIFPIIHASVLARKTWYMRNKYSLEFSRAQDYSLWCQAFKKNDLKIKILSDLLYFCREEGNVFSYKLINSYNHGYNIRKLYGLSNGASDFLKVKIKCLVIRGIFFLGLEQLIAERRNKKFLSKEQLLEQQALVNNILTSI